MSTLETYRRGRFSSLLASEWLRLTQRRVVRSLLLAALAYVLLERLRTIGLAGTELARAQVWILRCRLLKVGAVIVRNTRRVRFFLASAFPHQAAFRLAAQRFAFG